MNNLGMREKALENFLEMIQSLPDSESSDGETNEEPKGGMEGLGMGEHADSENPLEQKGETTEGEKSEDLQSILDALRKKGC